MSFGLSNAPSSFQGLMNHIFQKHLRKFILVCFYDILIYIKNLADHLKHLKIAFDLLVQHQLLAKRSKCVLASRGVEFLGNYISPNGVSTDPMKIEVVQSWQEPKFVSHLRGFLGLAGYYRKFIKGYGILSKPLTDLLKKDGFRWSEEAISSFEQLKKILITAPVLALPDFSSTFVVKTDACDVGIGAVLMQDRQLIAYLSMGLSR
ncbi:putative mitochondrial protein AtMg00860 [Nicotiana tabacum]|uniref:Mitochondrial protein AtMg00860 n=1 Tax=Nicotiana tabacum TaxID=4097 RepID=A0AC58SMC5_TOBAC